MKRLSVYYFKGHDLWYNPQHIREDMQRFVDGGVDSVCVAIHEANLHQNNLERVCEEAVRNNLQILGVPSRVGALMAGWHRGASTVSAFHPELWARASDGSPVHCFGPKLSLFHPQTPEVVAEAVVAMLKKFPLNGIIWDELKTLESEDHSDVAFEALGHPADKNDQAKATVPVFSRINERLIEEQTELTISLFLYSQLPDSLISPLGGIKGLSEFGCDGTCLLPEDPFSGEGGSKKKLLGNVERFQSVAVANGLRDFALIETQLLKAPALEKTIERLPLLFETVSDHLAYYDYPWGMEEPERFMPLIAGKMRQWRHG
jgi:hypothetical protein